MVSGHFWLPMDGFLVEAYSKTCFTTSQYILINFGLDIIMYLASLKVWLGWLGGCPIFYLFLICPYFGPLLHFFGPFWVIFWSMGLFLGSRSGSKTFFELTNVDYQFLFWKYSPIFWFFIRPKVGPFFCIFWALQGYFWGWGQVQKLFWDLLT